MIREVMIDEGLAGDAEAAAEIMGYRDLEHYIMDLIERDLREKGQAAQLAAAGWVDD